MRRPVGMAHFFFIGIGQEGHNGLLMTNMEDCGRGEYFSLIVPTHVTGARSSNGEAKGAGSADQNNGD